MTRLIDADALHKALYTKQKWVVHRNGKHNEGFTSDQVHFAIDEQPTIEAEPVRHGKWEEQGVFINKQIDEWQEARCSVCRLFHTTPYKYTFIKYAYCPYCGARMNEE